jgi:hypothetical protein
MITGLIGGKSELVGQELKGWNNDFQPADNVMINSFFGEVPFFES